MLEQKCRTHPRNRAVYKKSHFTRYFSSFSINTIFKRPTVETGIFFKWPQRTTAERVIGGWTQRTTVETEGLGD